MSVTQDKLYDYNDNLQYTIVKAPTANEYGEVLLAGLCTEDAAKTSVFVASIVLIDKGTSLVGSSEKYVNDYSFTKGYRIIGVGDNAFSGNTTLTNVDLSSRAMRSIGKSAFQNCTALTEVKFSGDVSNDLSIGESAFSGAGLTSLSLPEGLTTIGNKAFYECKSLTGLTLPSTVETIGDQAFQSCGLDGELNLKKCSALKSLGGSCFIFCKGIRQVTFPEEHAVDLGGSCFQGCESLVIAKNVSCLPGSCFNDCTALQDVYVMSGEEIKTIGSYCFSGCVKLGQVDNLSSVETLGESCFRDCSTLTSLSFLGNKLKTIGRLCFYKCSGIVAVDIPATVEALESQCFAECSNLATLNFLGNNLKAIGSHCFYHTKIDKNKIVFPSSLEILGDGYSEVFYYDPSDCKNMVIPASVKEMSTLDYIYSESSFRFLGKTPPTLQEGAKVGAKWTFQVPASAVDAYKAAFPTVTVEAIPSDGCDYEFALSKNPGEDVEKYGTICLPRQADYTLYMAKLYKVVGISADNKVQIREVEDGVIRAGVPYIYKTDDSRQKVRVFCSGIPVSEPDNSDLLKSTFTEGSYVPVGAYVMQNNGSDNMFHIVNSTSFTFVPYRAYLQLPEEMTASTLKFDFGEATGIENVTTGTHKADGAVYDLSGRRVLQPRSGFYIKNGKKYIIK